jgi:hypothetical protein
VHFPLRVIPAEAGISYAKAVPGFYSSSVSFVDLWVLMRSRLGGRDDCVGVIFFECFDTLSMTLSAGIQWGFMVFFCGNPAYFIRFKEHTEIAPARLDEFS